MGGQVDQLRQSWEEERRELAVQNQLLEEELADMKGMLMQERQRSVGTLPQGDCPTSVIRK